MRDPTDIHANAREDADLDSRRRAQQQRDVEDLRQIMQTAVGRRFVTRMLASTGVWPLRNPMTVDGRTTEFNCGAFAVGLPLLEDLKTHCFSEYMALLEETPRA